MEIQLTGDVSITEVSPTQFNTFEINRIKDVEGGAVRQESKAPT